MLSPATGESITPRMGLLPGAAAGSPGSGGNNGCWAVGDAGAVTLGGRTGAAAAHLAISIWVLSTGVAGVAAAPAGFVSGVEAAALGAGGAGRAGAADAACFCF